MLTIRAKAGLGISILMVMTLCTGLSQAGTGVGLSNTFTLDNRFSFPVYDPEDDSLLGYVVYLCGSDADPVNTATGNFTHDETDLSIATRTAPLQLSRYYNSKDAKDSPLGVGWTHSYNISLATGAGSSGTLVSVRWGDGRTDYWDDLGGGVYEPNMPGLVDVLEVVGSDWQLTRKNLDVYVFDSAGMLQTITDKNGNTFTLGYDGSSRLSTVTDPAGRAVTFTYDVNDQLVSITDFDSPARTVQYQYTSGRLTQVTDLLGNTITYTYTAEGWLGTITNQLGVTTITNTYDVDGRVIQQTDGNGNITTFTYGTEGEFKKTTITYPDGVSNDHLHSENNLLLMIRYPQGSVSYAYDDDMNRTKIIDRNGGVTDFTYDLRGNVLTTTDPNDPEDENDGGVTVVTYTDVRFPDFPTQKTDVLGRVTSWVYDANGNCTTETDAMGNTTQWTYNGFGQKLTQTDKNGNTTTFEYSPNGQLTKVIDTLGNETQFSYDTLWRPVLATNALGNSTQTTYDKLDRVTQVNRPLSTASYSYDPVGNRLSETNPSGNTTQYAYDNNSNLVTVTDAVGNSATSTYDGLNRRVSTTNALGNTTQFAYDDMGRLATQTNPEGNVTTLTYDAQGNVLTQTDGSGVTVSYEYDSLNRLVSQSDELGNTQALEYDKTAQLTKSTDAKGNITQYSYDPLGRLVSVVNPEGLGTDYQYDPMGNVLTVIDTGSRTIYDKTYNVLGQVIDSTDGNGNISTYSYDPVGNRISETDANGDTKIFTYDAENRLVNKLYQDSSQVTYSYDSNGNLLTVQNTAGITTFVYDVLNRLLSSTDSFGKTVEYSYDAVGNRIGITYPADSVNPARTVTYAYDAANRLDTIIDWDARVWDYTLDGAGRITQLTYPNGTEKNQAFDEAGRLSELAYKDSLSAEFMGYHYTHDALGNPIDADETGTLLPDVTALTKNLQMNFDADNRLTTTNANAYSYDNVGNVTSVNRSGQITTFAYNDENRLTSQVTGTSTIQHIYNGLDNRIARIDNGTETQYVLDYGRGMSHVLCETDDSGNITAYYIHGPEIVGRIEAGGFEQYYHTDPIGSVVALTDGTETVTDRYAYTPFGSPAGREGTTDNPFTYVGGYGVMTEADGLYFMRARFYEPLTARFLGKDPVEGTLQQPMSLYRYSYAFNNPIMNIDSDGNYSWSTAWEGTKQVGVGLLNTGGGVLTTATGSILASAGIGVPIAIKGLNTGAEGVTQVISGFENIFYRATTDKAFQDKSVNILEEWVDAADNDRLTSAYNAVDTSLDIISLVTSLDNLSNGLGVGLKAGGGGNLQFYSIASGQFISNAEGWLTVLKYSNDAVSSARKIWDMANVPAFYDPKLNVYYVNNKTKKIN